MNLEELREVVGKFGKPAISSVLQQRLAISAFAEKHGNKDDPLSSVVTVEDIEVARAYNIEPENLIELSPQIHKSLVEQYRAETASLKQLELYDVLSRREGVTGSSKSKKSAKEVAESESK